MKKRISVAILFVAVICLFTACATHTDTKSDEEITNNSAISAEYPYRSLEEIVRDSSLIVRARKTGELPSELRDNMRVTDNTFEILEVFKGDKKVSDEITVEFLGGNTWEDSVFPSQIAVKNDEEVLLILSYPTDANDKISSKDYYVFYPPSGIFFKSQDATENDAEFISFDRYTYRTSEFQEEVNRILNE